MSDVKENDKVIEKKDKKSKQENLATVINFKPSFTDEELIKLDKAGADIRFNPRDFREIPENVLLQCSRILNNKYSRVLGALEVMGKTPKHEVESGVPFNLNGHIVYQYEDMEPGYHYTRINVQDKKMYERLGYEYIKDAHVDSKGRVTMVEMRVLDVHYQASLKKDAKASQDILNAKRTEWEDRIHDDKKYGIRNYIPKDEL